MRFGWILGFFLVAKVYFGCAQQETDFTDTSGVHIFLSAGVNFGKAYNHQAYTLDINGGFEFKNIYIGGFGNSIVNDIETEDTIYDNMQMDLGYGGFIVGYEFFSECRFYLFGGIQWGWGVVSLSKKKIANKVEYMERVYYDNVFIMKPFVSIGINLSSHFTINIGSGRLFMTGLSSLKNFSNEDFNGIFYKLMFRYHL